MAKKSPKKTPARPKATSFKASHSAAKSTAEAPSSKRPAAKEELNGFPSYCSVPIVPKQAPKVSMSPGRLELVLSLKQRWVNGTVLHYYFFNKPTDGRNVRFTDGSTVFMPWRTGKAEMDVVRKAFKIWMDVGIGLQFVEVDKREDAEIRIGFERGDGAWSFLGREIIDLTGLGVNDRTMNFGWDLTRSPDEIDTAVHEIGHTLGFEHEQQNPVGGIEWDVEAVVAALAQPPNEWDRETTFHNIIRKISPDEVQASQWDPDSIMHYPFGPGLILRPEEFRINGITPAGGLSERDKTWVKTFYPPLAETLESLTAAQSIKLDLKPGEQKNFLIEPSGTRQYKFQTFGPSDLVMVLFEQDGKELRYVSGKDDSGTDENATLEQKLFRGRRYVLRVRLTHSERPDETAIMMW